jgi:hypothetical protein
LLDAVGVQFETSFGEVYCAMSLVQDIVHPVGTPERPADAIDWLRPTPNKILTALRRLHADRRAAVRSLFHEIANQRARVQRHAADVQRLTSRDHGMGLPDDARVVAAGAVDRGPTSNWSGSPSLKLRSKTNNKGNTHNQ